MLVSIGDSGGGVFGSSCHHRPQAEHRSGVRLQKKEKRQMDKTRAHKQQKNEQTVGKELRRRKGHTSERKKIVGKENEKSTYELTMCTSVRC